MAELQDLRSFRLPAGFRGKSAFSVQLWWIVQAILFRPSPQFMYPWRRFLLRLFGAKIGVGVLLRPSVRVTYPWKLAIGNYSWIGDRVELYTLDRISIGDNAVVSQGCYLCTGSHDFSKPTFDMRTAPILIGSEAWIAAEVFIAPGVTIGRGAVIGARSTVFKDIPELAIAYGHTCEIRGTREQTIY